MPQNWVYLLPLTLLKIQYSIYIEQEYCEFVCSWVLKLQSCKCQCCKLLVGYIYSCEMTRFCMQHHSFHRTRARGFKRVHLTRFIFGYISYTCSSLSFILLALCRCQEPCVHLLSEALRKAYVAEDKPIQTLRYPWSVSTETIVSVKQKGFGAKAIFYPEARGDSVGLKQIIMVPVKLCHLEGIA